MAVTRMTFAVHTDDDKTTEVTTDQRDHVAMEVHYKTGFPTALEVMTLQAFRYIAWHALKRTGVIDGDVKFPDWDSHVIEVEPLDEAEAASPLAPSPTPGSPAATAGG